MGQTILDPHRANVFFSAHVIFTMLVLNLLIYTHYVHVEPRNLCKNTKPNEGIEPRLGIIHRFLMSTFGSVCMVTTNQTHFDLRSHILRVHSGNECRSLKEAVIKEGY